EGFDRWGPGVWPSWQGRARNGGAEKPGAALHGSHRAALTGAGFGLPGGGAVLAPGWGLGAAAQTIRGTARGQRLARQRGGQRPHRAIPAPAWRRALSIHGRAPTQTQFTDVAEPTIGRSKAKCWQTWPVTTENCPKPTSAPR